MSTEGTAALVDLITTIWPLFALILAGLALRRSGFPGDAFWPAADRLNYFVLFPALLVSSLAKAPLGDPALLKIAVAIGLAIATASALFWWARALRSWPPSRFGPLLQGAIRFNTYLGLAVIGSVFGPTGLAFAAVVIAILVPTVNILSVIALTAGGGVSPGRLLASVAMNPLILACLFGIMAELSGIGLPFGTDRFLFLLASASLPLGLLCVGAALRLAAARAETPTLVVNALVRLIAMPCLAALAGTVVGLDGTARAVMVILFALPTAPTAYVLTTQLKGDAGLMAGLVTLQTLLSALTLPIVIAWLMR